MIDLFPPDRYDAIISNAGGCGSHLRRYGPLLADDPALSRARAAWDAKLRDVHEWLRGDRLPCPPQRPRRSTGPMTRHVPRLLSPGARTEDCAPAARVAAADSWRDAGTAARSRPGAAARPASTPSPSLEQADLLLARKVEHIVETGAGFLATANPGCQLQIARGLDASGSGIRVVHPVSLLAAAYRAEARSILQRDMSGS